jgi:hypothetical protein
MWSILRRIKKLEQSLPCCSPNEVGKVLVKLFKEKENLLK